MGLVGWLWDGGECSATGDVENDSWAIGFGLGIVENLIVFQTA
jgi:hypothetical protein